MSAFLVTTEDRRAWPGAEADAVALWRSCLGQNPPADRRWRMAPDFYPDVAGRLRLAGEARDIHESVMPRLADALNRYHGLAHDRRHWEIIAGPFLTRFIRVVLNRYLKLELCAREGLTRSIHLRRAADVAPVDTLHLINLTEDDAWNHETCAWFLRDYFPSIELEERDLADGYSAVVPESPAKGGAVRAAMERLRVRRRLYINDLHATRSLKLQVLLQSGHPWIAPEYFRVNAPVSARTSLVIEPSSAAATGYRSAVDRYLPRLLPKYLVESFPAYRQQVAREPLDRRKRVMITSTGFDADEIFKMKAADEIGRGGRYVVLQHGGVYGVNPFFENTVEERTADAFVTWGSWKKSAHHVPGFCLTTVGLKVRRERHPERLVLVTVNQRRKKFLWDVEPEFDSYMNAQFGFIDSLGPLQDKLTVRLHAAHLRSRGREKERFESRYPNLRLDAGVESLWKSIGQYRLTVFTYDSSGLLEMLSLNVPVIGFWDRDGFDQVTTDAEPYYDLLRDAGIVHHSPRDLGEFVRANWNGIDEWWSSAKVQDARARFCARYAAPAPQYPARALRQLILRSDESRTMTALTPRADRA